MNETIINNYLHHVSDNDVVFFLGDLTIKRGSSSKPLIANIFKNLPGNKHLILGNHDYFTKKFYKEECGFLSVRKKIRTSKYILVHDPAHFTIKEINSNKQLIHGHVHSLIPRFKFTKNSKLKKAEMYDAGVDANSFFPVPLLFISNYLKKGIDL